MIECVMRFLAIASFVGFVICMYSGYGKGSNVQLITGFRIVRKRIKRWIQNRRGKNEL